MGVVGGVVMNWGWRGSWDNRLGSRNWGKDFKKKQKNNKKNPHTHRRFLRFSGSEDVPTLPYITILVIRNLKKSRDPSSSLRNLEDHKVSKSRKQDGSTSPGS